MEITADQLRFIELAKERNEIPQSWSNERAARFFRSKATLAAERLEQIGIKR